VEEVIDRKKNEKTSSPKPETAKDGPGDKGIAEKLTRDELGRVARADLEACYRLPKTSDPLTILTRPSP
jgi:hypothetical protein